MHAFGQVCTLVALHFAGLGFGLRHRVSGPPSSSQSESSLILDAEFALAPMMPKCRSAEKCLSQATHLYKPLLCDKVGQVSAKGCEMLRRCQDASLRQPRQQFAKGTSLRALQVRGMGVCLGPAASAPRHCAVVHLATVKKLQLLNRHGIGQTTCHWLRMCLLDLAQPA